MASTSTSFELKQGDPYYLPPVPSVKGADTETAIIEAYRIAAAKIVSEAVDIPLETAYPGIDVGNKKADLYVAMPRFRLGGKSDQWAEKVVAHVSSMFSDERLREMGGGLVGFSSEQKRVGRVLILLCWH